MRRWWSSKRLGTEVIAIVLGIYFTFFLNQTLWQDVEPTFSFTALFADGGFLLWLFLGICTFQVALLAILLWGSWSKPIAVALIVITVMAHYFSVQYGTQYDTSMVQNVFATDLHETSELMSSGLILHLLLYGALPIVLVCLVPVTKRPFRAVLTAKITIVGLALLISLVSIALNYKTFSSLMRAHTEIRHLILPASPLISSFRVAMSNPRPAHAENKVLIDPAATRVATTNARPLMVVMVVGETVRAQNWGLSGYERNTTPMLSKLSEGELFNAPYAVSCGTSTEVSVPCMFSVFGRHDYDEKKIKQTESVVELAGRLGVTTHWVDNQSGCKGVCDRVGHSTAASHTPEITGPDAEHDRRLVVALDRIHRADAGDELIMLHMMGNHGPTYHKRYPKDFERYLPVCKDSNFAKCTQADIQNAYDNAIVYTDSLLAEIIENLKNIKTHDVALIYVSDHGESLGESGLYLHGVPYRFAPDTQTRVPFVVWMPKATQDRLRLSATCLQKRFASPLHHDHLSHTLLNLFSIQTNAYDEKYDLLKDCRG